MSVTTPIQYHVENTGVLSPANQLTLRWVLIGAVAGILGDLAYFLAVTQLFGPKPSLYLGLAFGPLLSVAFIGYYYFFRAHKLSPALQITTLFGVIAGTIVNTMLVVQSAQRFGVPLADRESLGAAWGVANMTQLGLDVSWDIYLSLATILLAVVMWDHPRFHKVLVIVTGLLGAGLLILNLWTFPIPPGEAGLIDLGPVLGGWYLILTLIILGSRKWLAEQLANSDQSPMD